MPLSGGPRRTSTSYHAVGADSLEHAQRSVRGWSALASGAGTRVAAHQLRARCLHAAAGTGAARAAEQTGDLQPTLSHQRCHSAGDRSRSQAPGSRDRLLQRAPHLGPATSASSSCSLRAGRWRPRSESLLLLCFRLLQQSDQPTSGTNSPAALPTHSQWNCPLCGGTMQVVERLSAAQLFLRSPPHLSRCTA
jgi:hypothetical protein